MPAAAICFKGENAMQVLLVSPPPYQVIEPFYDTPPYPRTALACLAGYLRAAGIGVEVLDCKLDRLDHDRAAEIISDKNVRIVGFTAFTNEIIQAARLADAAKKRRPDIVTMIGGVHASVLPERTLREFPCFDYACVGEGEETLLEFVRLAVETANPFALRENATEIPGLACLAPNGDYRYGGERGKIMDLDSLPMPAWDLFRPCGEYIIHSQRGCPYHCPFCVNPNGRIVRKESPSRVMDGLERLLSAFGCKTIYFGDEIFTIDRERTIAICRSIVKSGLRREFKWSCTTHVNSMDRELAEAMREAGCESVGLGIESGDSDVLGGIAKGTSIKKIEDVARQMREAKLPFNAFFILGQPNETKMSAWKSVDLAVRLNPDVPVFGIMTPYPGTKVAAMAAAGQGGYRLSAKDWNDYNKQFANALEFEGISRRELKKIQFLGYVKVFLKNGRFRDFLGFCWKYRRPGWNLLKKLLAGRAS
jgi:radical SAM superfamily enzyme YgiQ (UPF0313 family)